MNVPRDALTVWSRLLITFFKIIGWLIARTPESLLRPVSALLGDVVLWLAPGRRRLILSNLDHAFPARSASWRRDIARKCSRRIVETALLSLAMPYLSERRIRVIARPGPSILAWVREREEEGRGWSAPDGRRRATVFATFHQAYWECQTWYKLLWPAPLPEFGVIFRPVDNPKLDAYIKGTRARFGMRLLSRKEGFAEALKILRRGGCIGLLFDQNAGMQGALTLLFGRVCSTSELTGLLTEKFDADLRITFPRRTGFWRISFESEPIVHDGTSVGITLALNRCLEKALADEELCASWLWVHDRWRHQDMPPRRFRLESKRDFLAEDVRARGLAALPRRTRLWVRLPNWLGDIMMAIPLLRALRVSRPDMELTLVAHARFLPLLASFGVGDALHALPPRGLGYFAHFRALRRAYPDVWLLFTNSFRGDLEAWLAGSPQRFGLVRPGKRRPLLSHVYRVPAGFDESRHHQIELWENFLRHFGLAAAPDLAPKVAAPPERPAAAPSPIALIPGSENNPAKRWPIAHWRTLIAALPDERFVLFGTAGDAPIAAAIAAEFPAGRIENLAGKTDLAAYAERLAGCRSLITNDTGGMHLANALGVPLIALFGPTNPVRTGPVFTAPVTILQPENCPPTGGAILGDLSPAAVVAAFSALHAPVGR